MSPLATPSATREVLERHGLFTKYALGQNFLVNDDVVRKIVKLADVGAADHVLEVGPGIGTLTAALLQRAGRVTSVEMDNDLPAVLADTLAPWADRFSLLQMDALDLQMEDLQGLGAGASGADAASEAAVPKRQQSLGSASVPRLPDKMVSNLPYAVAATVVLDYFQRFGFLGSATVMVQKEVADRIMAKPGTKAYGAYTLKLSLFARPVGRFPVSAGNFFPPPRVESAVVRLDRADAADESGEVLTRDELLATCTMADAAFATRRKTLANSCKTYFAGRPEVQAQLPNLFDAAGVDPRRRGETLTRDEFVRLGKGLAAAQPMAPGWR